MGVSQGELAEASGDREGGGGVAGCGGRVGLGVSVVEGTVEGATFRADCFVFAKTGAIDLNMLS